VTVRPAPKALSITATSHVIQAVSRSIAHPFWIVDGSVPTLVDRRACDAESHAFERMVLPIVVLAGEL
jgi:hypothetical protein